MNLWLVPTDELSFQATLASPVDLSDWNERPGSFPLMTRLWGVRTDPEQGSWERNCRNLDRLQTGDRLLFYRNAKGQYTATGTVGPVENTEYIRDTYWNGGPALDVYVVENYDDSIDASPKMVNRLLNYSESYVPQGFSRVSDDRPIAKLLYRLNLDYSNSA